MTQTSTIARMYDAVIRYVNYAMWKARIYLACKGIDVYDLSTVTIVSD